MKTTSLRKIAKKIVNYTVNYNKMNVILLIIINMSIYFLNIQLLLAVPRDLEIKDKMMDLNVEYVSPKPTDVDLVNLQNKRYKDKPLILYRLDNDIKTAAEVIYEKENLYQCKRFKNVKWEIYKRRWYREIYKSDPLDILMPEDPIRQPKYDNVDIRYLL